MRKLTMLHYVIIVCIVYCLITTIPLCDIQLVLVFVFYLCFLCNK